MNERRSRSGSGKSRPRRGDSPPEVGRSEEAPASGAPDASEAEPFETTFARAESAVDALERGSLSLQESLLRYEEGLRAIQRCYEVLRDAERRIEVLGGELGAVAEGDEGPVWVPAASMPGLKEALGAMDRSDQPVRGQAEEEGPGEDGGTS